MKKYLVNRAKQSDATQPQPNNWDKSRKTKKSQDMISEIDIEQTKQIEE